MKPKLYLYLDTLTRKLGVINEDAYKEYPASIPLLLSMVENYDCCTIGYWPRQIGLGSKVYNMLPKQSFSSLGYGDPPLEEKVAIIRRVGEEFATSGKAE